MVMKRGDDEWNKVPEGIKRERERMEATHRWQNHNTGAWVPDNRRGALSALDNCLQTLFMWERNQLLTCYLVFPFVCRKV